MQNRKVVAMASLIFLSVSSQAVSGVSAASALAAEQDREVFYTLENLQLGGFKLAELGPQARAAGAAETAGITYATPEDVPGAVIDASLLDKGALSAASADFVDLSWEAAEEPRTYRVLRDDKELALTGSPSYRDDSVEPGSTYSYRVETVLPEATTVVPSGEVTIRGFEVSVPFSSDVATESAELNQRVLAAANNAGTQLLYRTFIPMAKVEGPPLGCTYNKPYQYGGDNRGYVTGGLASFRTQVAANIRWTVGDVMTNVQNGPTNVYKADGTHYTSQTQNTNDMWVKQLARTSTYADLRVSVKSPNPFSGGNSIQGAFTISITRNGSYGSLSGSHRQMPSHEVYVMGSSNATWRTVYRKDYVNLACLISGVCPTATMAGSGSY